jgi:hypothetical protein
VTPSSPALDALILLTRANAGATLALDNALSRVGLWLNDLSLLQLLRDAGRDGLSRVDLAALLSQSQSETLRRIKPMEKLDWIARTESGNFRLSDNGRALELEASGLAANRSEHWLAGLLNDSEISQLVTLLGKLC